MQRELREGARRPVNHRLRFLSAGVGTLVLWFIVAGSDKPSDQLGGWLFASLHTLLLGLIALIVPALTADGIAQEKREGTLGLLFLTPLSAGGIVAGKALAQGLRAFTLWLAALPILTIPFMTGGVTWFNAGSAVSLEFCAMVLCLAAGLLASSLARERNTAFLLAYGFGAIFLYLFSQLFLVILLVGWRGFGYLKQGWPLWDWEAMSIFSGQIDIRGIAGWSALTALSAILGRLWKLLCWLSPPTVLLIFCVIARFAAWRVERSWQDKVASPRREGLLRRYCTPLFRRGYRRAMQRTLDRNPIAWLQQYSWKARLGKWGLCLAFLPIAIGYSRDPGPSHSLWVQEQFVHRALLLTMAGIYTFVGVGGFLEEKRSGALELLLVTPISVNKIILGRVWGLWKLFLPSGLVLAAADARWRWNFWPDLYSFAQFEDMQGAFIVVCGFLALPVFATYFALRVKNLIVAAVLTWIALWIPFAIVQETRAFVDILLHQEILEVNWAIALFFSYAAFALLACSLLRHSLSRRIYSF